MDYFQIKNNLKSFGLIPKEIIVDGEIHRSPTTEKPNKNDGWYVCYDTHIIVGNWITGDHKTFMASGSKLTFVDRKEIHASIEKRKSEKIKMQLDAAMLARDIYARSDIVQQHKYLAKKGINSVHRIKVLDSQLVIPLYDLQDSRIKNIQRIYPNGTKRFLKNGQIKGLVFPYGRFTFQGASTHIYICEGFATAISIHQITNRPVLAAMNAGNLLTIAQTARAKWPDANIVIAGDDDTKTEQQKGINPGVKKATEAAAAIKAKVSFPPFTPQQKEAGLTDWNDYYTSKKATA